jgi:hypothetical protein
MNFRFNILFGILTFLLHSENELCTHTSPEYWKSDVSRIGVIPVPVFQDLQLVNDLLSKMDWFKFND